MAVPFLPVTAFHVSLTKHNLAIAPQFQMWLKPHGRPLYWTPVFQFLLTFGLRGVGHVEWSNQPLPSWQRFMKEN